MSLVFDFLKVLTIPSTDLRKNALYMPKQANWAITTKDENPSLLFLSDEITLTGKRTIRYNETLVYKITNYNLVQSYSSPVALAGSVAMNDDTIFYTAPGSGSVAGFTISGVTVNLTINNSTIETPIILSPNPLSVEMLDAFTISSSPFNSSVTTDKHKSTILELYYADDLTTSLIQKNFGIPLVNFVLDNSAYQLLPAKKYGLRIRYESSSGDLSEWSTFIFFTTQKSFLPTRELGIYSSPTRSNMDLFGNSMAMSDDSLTLLVVDNKYGQNSRVPIIRVFTRLNRNSPFQYTSSITDSVLEQGNVTNKAAIAINKDGTKFIVGPAELNDTVFSAGTINRGRDNSVISINYSEDNMQLYQSYGTAVAMDKEATIYAIANPKKNSNTGTVEIRTAALGLNQLAYRINPTITNSGNDTLFGTKIAMNRAGTKLLVSAPNSVSCYVSLYNINSTEATLVNNFMNPDSNNKHFGSAIAMNETGDIVAIISKYSTTDYNKGILSIYSNKTGSWVLVSTLDLATRILEANRSNFSISMSALGDIISVGCPTTDTSGWVSLITTTDYLTYKEQYQNEDIVNTRQSLYYGLGSCVLLSLDGRDLIAANPMGTFDSNIISGQIFHYR